MNDCCEAYIRLENLPQKIVNQLKGLHEVELQPLKDVEARYIRQAFWIYGNTPERKKAAADVLGISRSTYYRTPCGTGAEVKRRWRSARVQSAC